MIYLVSILVLTTLAILWTCVSTADANAQVRHGQVLERLGQLEQTLDNRIADLQREVIEGVGDQMDDRLGQIIDALSDIRKWMVRREPTERESWERSIKIEMEMEQERVSDPVTERMTDILVAVAKSNVYATNKPELAD